MNETEKCRIRLAHWKDHNVDHVKGYEEVALILEQLGVPKAPEMIRRGICFVEAANVEFEKALKALAAASNDAGLPSETGTSVAHAHSHAHVHDHVHDHDHDHDHDHVHDHDHCGRHHQPCSGGASPGADTKEGSD